MPTERILITVKTYPAISRKYGELVCTAGLREDGSWIRIYPIPFRRLEYGDQYKKYQWITAPIERNTSDFRPESYKVLKIEQLQLHEVIDTANNWELRKRYCLKNVRTSITRLIEEAKDPALHTSLATYKPRELIDFVVEPIDPTRRIEKIKQGELKKQQGNLFARLDSEARLDDPEWYRPAQVIPYRFSYRFVDEEGAERKLMIEDWEVYELYRNCLKREPDEQAALAKVRQKYWNEFKEKDLYFFLGTTLEFHRRKARNPFIIIGIFYPKKETPPAPTLF
jgi:hypothetical protein